MNYFVVPRLGAAALALLVFPLVSLSTPAYANCTPVTVSGTPAMNTTVTCTGATLNQNSPAGYGTGGENGLTINVQMGASVEGTGAGIDVGQGAQSNTIINAGTISDDGTNAPDVNGINTSGSIVLTNLSTGVVSASTTDTTFGAFAVNPSTSLTGSNAGFISANANAQEATAIQSNAIDFTNTGTITATGTNANGTFAVFGVNSLSLTNSGTISADGGTGVTGTALESIGTVNVTNQAGGMIKGIGPGNQFSLDRHLRGGERRERHGHGRCIERRNHFWR